MSTDASLTDRVRDALEMSLPVEGKRMFGGTCFLAEGKIVATVRHDGALMVRVAPSRGEALQAEPGAGPAMMGAREMGPSWVQVDARSVAGADRLAYWLDLAVEHHRSSHPGRPGGPDPAATARRQD